MLLIDPNMGYLGLGVSSMIWLGAFLYSRQLVSAIWATKIVAGEEDQSRLAVATLKLPFLTQPTILRKTVYDPDSNNFDGSVEDVHFTNSEIISTPSVKFFAPGDLALCEDKIQHDAIVRYDGDFRRLRGHIALKKTGKNDEKVGYLASLPNQKLLMDISATDEVMPNASATLGYHLFNTDYRLASVKRMGRNSSKKLGNTSLSVGVEKKTRFPNYELHRPVSQLEIARGILNESMKRKGETGKDS